MILLFSDPDTFHLALTGGFVPPEVAAAKAAVAFDPHGRVSVETAGKLTRKASAELARLGVAAVKRHVGPETPVSCWPQILPAVRDPAPPQLSSQAPVLFELEAATDLPVLVGEMLRLGNDRQSVRWLDDQRVLLRVVGPPYYTLLRALDQTAGGTTGTVRAYVEQAPRVWVQVGYTHPLAAKVALDEGQLLLVRPPRDWALLTDGPFADVYEVLKFDLPAERVDWSEAAVREKLAVPLRLVPGNAADSAQLWVLRGDATAQLDAFVRDADERVAQRLKFAVAAGPTGEAVIVLRTTTSKVAPPALQLAGAVGFKPYHKLANLYVPAGTRLHPTLRRDAVRKLLAEDTDQLVWLSPGEGGSFTPETLPEDSFRPLEDWVDYVIETNHAPLAAWVEATRFDFDHFVCADGPPKPPKNRDDEKGRRRGKDADAPPAAGKSATRKDAGPGGQTQTTAFLPAAAHRQKGEWELRRKELEDRFTAVDGPLDHPDRRALWPELAVANTGYGDTAEAAVCWVNALWGTDPAPPQWVESWFRSEFPTLPLPITAAELDSRTKPTEPTAGEAREFAAMLLWLSHQDPVPGWFRARLAAVQKYLETHERKLPVRAVWLAATRLAALVGADTLGLARVRDRLLTRLLDGGISPERDLPGFLRFAGRTDAEHARHARSRMADFHRDVREWSEAGLARQYPGRADAGGVATLAYIDLFFAFGLAQLGDADAAGELVESATRSMARIEPQPDVQTVSRFLSDALNYRVRQATLGQPHAGLLPTDLLDTLRDVEKKSEGPNNPLGLGHYAINRLRQQSRILEPQEKLDPYSKHSAVTPLRKALADLPDVHDPARLARTVRNYLDAGVGGPPTPESRFEVLVAALPVAARAGETFTLELLARVPDALRTAPAVGLVGRDQYEKPGILFDRSLFLAGHFDRRDVITLLVERFVEFLAVQAEGVRFELISLVTKQCIRSLRKIGQRDAVDTLLTRLQAVALGGRTAEQLRTAFVARPDAWVRVLQSLLNIASGWLACDQPDRTAAVFSLAREELAGRSKLQPVPFVSLAQSYVAALGQGHAKFGLPLIADLIRTTDPVRVADTWTTRRYYSRLHLNLAEEIVLAVVSDEFAHGPAGRRWLDEDELLVRRRIHADMRAHLARSGLGG